MQAAQRRRILAIVGLAVIVVIATSLRGVATFYVDYLWFGGLHQTGVWSAVLGAKLALAAIFVAVAFCIVFVNLWIAERTASDVAVATTDDQVVERYQEILGTHPRLVRIGVALIIALFVGAGAANQWKDWLLFTNSVNFGQKDATFGKDIGFFVFRLPFIDFVTSWLFATLVVTLLASMVMSYFHASIRIEAPPGTPWVDRVNPSVKVHASVLLAVLSLVKTAEYWFGRYQLTFSTRGTVDGALYTDSNIQLTAINLLLVISVFACVLFLVNIWRRGWALPAVAVVLWGVVAVLGGVAVPAMVQRFGVQPSEAAKERPYLKQNIAATRGAFGLNKVKVSSFADDGKITAAKLQDNAATIQNVRLWDPAVMQEVFTKLQGIRGFYQVGDPDIDRYMIDGKLTQVLTSSRDIDVSSLPTKSWVAEHLSYTHGYGNIMAPTNASDTGQPVFTNKNIPVVTKGTGAKVTQPATYFGEGQSGYVIADSKTKEIDYVDEASNTKYNNYEGSGGIRIGKGLGGFVHRAAISLRFADINPLISSNVDSGSKVLLYRDVRTRVQTLAPFLDFDSDPYVVIRANGELDYIIDAYTTTAHFPNAQRAITSDLPTTSGLNTRFNYVRNSVKAVVNAYDGTVKLYVVDPTDPLVKSYERAFPHLFTPQSRIPADLAAHFRYPEDLFKVQTKMYGRYHVTDPDAFYTQENTWEISADPNKAGLTNGAAPGAVDANGNAIESGAVPMDPYYLLMRPPGQKDESFLLLRPFAPKQSTGSTNKQVLTGFMTAQSDPSDYGRLDLYRLPANNLPSGPFNVAAQMMQDRKVSATQTLLCNASDGGGGSECEFGNLLVIPIDQSLLYVRPWYVKSSGNNLPELQQVIVGYEDNSGNLQVAVESTLRGALVDLFGPNVPKTGEKNPAPPLNLSLASQAQGDDAPASTTTTTAPGGGGTTASSTTVPSGPTTFPEGPTTTLPVPSGSQAELIDDLNQAFDDADAALKRGDLEAYAADIKRAQAIARRLQAD